MTVVFDDFWREYPRRTAKPAAVKAWDRAVEKMKLDPAAIVAGAKRYAEAKRGTEQQYIAHPATWINQQRWLDEEPATATAQNTVTAPTGPNYSAQVTATRIAQDLCRKMLERTRHENWSKIETAASRLKDTTPSELWDAMGPELKNRAWDLAVGEALGGEIAPQSLEITRDNWIHGKERSESRARCIRAIRNPHLSDSRPPPIIRTRRNPDDNHTDDDDPRPQDQGMAREAPPGDRGFGREHPDEWGSRGNPETLEDQDREGCS